MARSNWLLWPTPQAPFGATGRQCVCAQGYSGSGFCETVYTADDRMYQYFEHELGDAKVVVISIKAKADAHIGLFTSKHGDSMSGLKRLANMYEIVLSGWGNTMSVIRKGMQSSNQVQIDTTGLLSTDEERTFWLSAVRGKVLLCLPLSSRELCTIKGTEHTSV